MAKQAYPNRYKIIIFATILVVIYIAMMTYNKQASPRRYDRQFSIMGTIASVTFYGPPEKTAQAADTVQAEFKKIEDLCNVYKPRSELSQLNKTAFEKPFKCSAVLWDILMESKSFYQISEGVFDITAKPLMNVWGFYRKRKQLPNQQELDQALKKVGLDKVIFNEKEHSVKFTVPGMSFDLGGIAKGYAVDQATRAVKKLGIKAGTINLGGNIKCLSTPPPSKKCYTIGIKDPLNKAELCGIIKVLNTSIATSGNYERYIILNNKRYTHIMNTKTGRPVENMLSATVVTPLATYSDALSTSIFIKASEPGNSKEFAQKICNTIPGTHVLIIKNKENKPHELEIIKIGSIWKSIIKGK